MSPRKDNLLIRLFKRIYANCAFVLTQRLDRQQAQIRSLEKNVKELNSSLLQLEEIENGLVKKIERKKTRIDRLEEQFQQVRAEIQAVTKNAAAAEKKQSEAGKLIEKKQSDTEGRVAQIDREVLTLLKTSYGADPWLEKAKDIHKGARCFLLGCGPSLNRMDLSKLKNEYVMGVNGTYLLQNVTIDYLCSVSNIFWKDHIDGLSSFQCKRMFLAPYIQIQPAAPVTWLRSVPESAYARVGERPWFFSKEAHRYVCLGGTVIAVCLQLLYHMGFQEVITLGLDHDYNLTPEEAQKQGFLKTASTLQAHFLDNYYNPNTQVHIDVPASERAYRLSLEAFESDGRKILNATPGTKLDIFPRVEYDILF